MESPTVTQLLQPFRSFLASTDAGIRNLYRSLLAVARARRRSVRPSPQEWETDMKDYKRLARRNIFPVLSTLLAVYFFYAFSTNVGVPPSPSLDWTSTAYLVLAVVFFLGPEVQRYHMTKLHDYEARLEESRGENLLLKSQVRTLMSAYNALLATNGQSSTETAQAQESLGSSTALPTPEEADTAIEELDSTLGEEVDQKQLDAEIEHYLNEEDFDIETALWDMRKVMEKELRRIARPEAEDKSNGNNRPLSSRALFEEFSLRYSEHAGMYSAYSYVMQVCDAAAHGREVPAACALEAFQMGFRILGALRKIAPAEASRAA